MADTRYFYACAHEQFPPDDLLRQAVEAEQAGFDGIGCSDHFQPSWGSGESLNESPLGMDWPEVGEQVDRMEEALELMHRLFDGERVTGGRFWKTKAARLHTRAPRRPPIYVSAFGERAAGVAARLGDGLWTLADPEAAPPI